MANHRTPQAKAKATAASAKNPQRFRDRKQSPSAPLGDPSVHMEDDEFQLSAWEAFKLELPWLAERDRALMEVVCEMRADVLKGEFLATSRLKVYSSLLSKLGASPADATKVYLGDDGEDEDEAGFA